MHSQPSTVECNYPGMMLTVFEREDVPRLILLLVCRNQDQWVCFLDAQVTVGGSRQGPSYTSGSSGYMWTVSDELITYHTPAFRKHEATGLL
jgi:hypothetical protein